MDYGRRGGWVEFSSSANESSGKKIPSQPHFSFPENIFIKLFHFPFLYEKLYMQRGGEEGGEKRKEKERYLILIRKQSEMEREKHKMRINK